MRASSFVPLILGLFTSSFLHASGLVRLPEGKALKLEIETVQTLEEGYYSSNSSPKRPPSIATFNNVYISDGERFRINMDNCQGAPPISIGLTTICHDGEATYTLQEPWGTLRVDRGPMDLRMPGTGEKLMSPFHMFYHRNPLIAMYLWHFRDAPEEAKFFPLDTLITARSAMGDLLKEASPAMFKGKTVLASSVNALDQTKDRMPQHFVIAFDARTKAFTGWRSESRDRAWMKEFSVKEWQEVDCGNGTKIGSVP